MFTNQLAQNIEKFPSNPLKKANVWKRIFPQGYKNEAKELIYLAIPTILTAIGQILPQFVSVVMCGRLSTKELDAVALANSIINMAGVAIGLGFSSACDTFFSQIFGSGDKKRMGVYLQKSFMVINLFILPLLAFHLNIEPVLKQLGQDEEISKKAAIYIGYFLPGLIFDYNFLILTRFLQNQNVVYPPMICAFIANIYNAVAQYVAIYILGYQFEASAVCQASCMFLMLLLLTIYTMVSGVTKSTWAGWTIEALYDWSSFVKLAIPGIFLVALEEWSYEVTMFLAGSLSDVQLGAQSIIFQIAAMIYMIPMGLGVAVNIRVGHQVGDFNNEGAITSYRVALTFIAMSTSVMLLIFLSIPKYIPLIFTSDNEIIEVVASVIPIFGIYHMIDGVNACSIGVLRGCGRQLFGAFVVFVAYYVIALPVGIPVTLWSGLQIQGLWFVMLCVAFCEAIFMFTMILLQNWSKVCVQAQTRIYGEMEDVVVKRRQYCSSSMKSEDLSGQFGDEEKASLLASNLYGNTKLFGYQSIPMRLGDATEVTFDRSMLCQILVKRVVALIVCASILIIGVILRMTSSQALLSCLDLLLINNNNNNNLTMIDERNLPWCNKTVINY